MQARPDRPFRQCERCECASEIDSAEEKRCELARFPALFPPLMSRLHSHEVIHDVILMRQPYDVSVGGVDAYHLGNSAATGGTISSSFQLRCAWRISRRAAQACGHLCPSGKASYSRASLHASSHLVFWKLTELLELSLCLVDDFGGAITPDLLRPY